MGTIALVLALVAGAGAPGGEEHEAIAAFRARAEAYVAVRDTSPGVAEGAIFTRDVAPVFREAVADLMSPQDTATLRSETRCPSDARVNHPLPPHVSHYVPPRLLYRFPELPPELEYRVVNADLVLWDVDADLVVDVLRDLFVVPSYA
jgi:hypothetical protein